MDEIEKLAAEIETANPVRKMMLAQQLLPLIVNLIKELNTRVNRTDYKLKVIGKWAQIDLWAKNAEG